MVLIRDPLPVTTPASAIQRLNYRYFVRLGRVEDAIDALCRWVDAEETALLRRGEVEA